MTAQLTAHRDLTDGRRFPKALPQRAGHAGLRRVILEKAGTLPIGSDLCGLLLLNELFYTVGFGVIVMGLNERRPRP
jgi:hypothetical protein